MVSAVQGSVGRQGWRWLEDDGLKNRHMKLKEWRGTPLDLQELCNTLIDMLYM